MGRSIVTRIRRAWRKRAFMRNNADIRRVYEEAEKAELLSSIPRAADLPASQTDHWNEFGFIILRGFFEQSVLDKYKAHLECLWQRRDGRADATMVYTERLGIHEFQEAIGSDRLANYRILDQYLSDPLTRSLSMHPRLVAILHRLMGHAPVVCNSILFEWGSEQELHSDMFYMPPISQDQMLATWIALDDVTDDNGPVIYVRGSHKLAPYQFSHGKTNFVADELPNAVASMQAEISDRGLPTERFLARRGDVLIWHSRLLHGGDVIRDRSLRRTSLVTHYYSTADLPMGTFFCAQNKDGSLMLIKKPLPADKVSTATHASQ